MMIFKHETILENVLRMIQIMIAETKDIKLKINPPDILIKAEERYTIGFQEFNPNDDKYRHCLIQIGRKATEKHMSEIRKLVKILL